MPVKVGMVAFLLSLYLWRHLKSLGFLGSAMSSFFSCLRLLINLVFI